MESLVFTGHKDLHSLGGASGGRSRPQREEPSTFSKGAALDRQLLLPILGRQVGLEPPPEEAVAASAMMAPTGDQGQEPSRFRKNFPGLPSD